jgi:hypothetical protein
MCKNKISVYFFALSLFLLIILSACQSSSNSTEIIAKGRDYFNDGDFEETILILRPYVYYHPKDYEAHFLLGKSFSNTNTDNEEILYKARYYLNKARDLSTSTAQRQEADDAYFLVKKRMGMGAGEQNAKDLHSAAERADLMNKKGQALYFFTEAGKKYLISEEYGKAQKDFSFGLDISLQIKDENSTKYLSDLILGLSTSYLLDNEPRKCLDTLKKLTSLNISEESLTAIDSDFLFNAANLLLIEGERKFYILGKSLNDEKSEIFNNSFNKLIKLQEKLDGKLSEEKKTLLARAWRLISEHSSDLKIGHQAKQALYLAQRLFISAGLEKDALDVGEKIADYEKSS